MNARSPWAEDDFANREADRADRERFVKRLEEHGTAYKIEGDEVLIQIKNGRDSDYIYASPFAYMKLHEVDFDPLSLLGQYFGFWDSSLDFIEVRIEEAGRFGTAGQLGAKLAALPGVKPVKATLEPRSGLSRLLPNDYEVKRDWKLQVDSDDARSIEVSASSERFMDLLGGDLVERYAVTAKLRGFECQTQEQAISAITRVLLANLLEIDMLYGISLDVQRRKTNPLENLALPALGTALDYPKVVYTYEPMELYRHGRSAQELPLTEFLAYYQVLEYFFPIYAREALIERLRRVIRNPRFDPDDAAAMGRLIGDITPRGGLNERAQLRETVRAVVDAGVILDLIRSTEESEMHFLRGNAITGVKQIRLRDGAPDLLDQLADRIYDIRCRVVHSKQENGEGTADLLLPTSSEVHALAMDIGLMRVVAQQALVAGGRRLSS